MKYFSFLLILCFLAACKTPATVHPEAEMRLSEFKMLKIGEFSGRKPIITATEMQMDSIFNLSFDRVSDIHDYRIFSFNDAKFFLGAHGEWKGKHINLATRLIPKDDGFYLDENAVVGSCVAKSCDGCRFVPSATGGLERCVCVNVDEETGKITENEEGCIMNSPAEIELLEDHDEEIDHF